MMSTSSPRISSPIFLVRAMTKYGSRYCPGLAFERLCETLRQTLFTSPLKGQLVGARAGGAGCTIFRSRRPFTRAFQIILPFEPDFLQRDFGP